MRNIVVQKYGGSSLADVEKIWAVARRIVETRKNGYSVVAVVSAMGKTTDDLLEQARQITQNPGRRELDMLLSTGERITMSLLSMAIQELGFEAISFTGSQSGIITSDNHVQARIIDVRPVRILDELDRDRIVIVAGYQGMSYKREITTLGRGGSDTTAVALASALHASYCEICKDVDGVYSADPSKIKKARKIKELNYDEMEALSEAGADVLSPDAIEFARSCGLKIKLTSTFKGGEGTLILQEQRREGLLRAATSQHDVVYLKLRYHNDLELSTFMELLADGRVSPSNMLFDGPEAGYLECVIDLLNLHDWEKIRHTLETRLGSSVSFQSGFCTVSIIGTGIGEEATCLAMAIKLLREAGIVWKMAFNRRHSFSFVVPKEHETHTLELLHDNLCCIMK